MPFLAYAKKVSHNIVIDYIRSNERENKFKNNYSDWHKSYQSPNQIHTVQLKEIPAIPFEYGLGYTFDEIAKNKNICKTSVFKQVKQFRESY